MIDNHIHTKLCKHAEGEVYQYVEAAINIGITEMAFTDHIPLPDNFDIAHRMQMKELDIYAEWISGIRSRYPEITIRFGIEADFYEGFEQYTESILNNYDFDLVIMSVHFLRHWSDDNWVFNYHFPDKSKREIYSDYIHTSIKGIKTGLFDVLGHVDIIKSPGDSLLLMIPDQIEKMLKTAKQNDMTLEINTSGFRKKTGESYPGLDWLDLIKKVQIPLTVGSDAHAPNQVGLEFDKVYRELIENSIFSVISYKNRRPQKVLISK